MKNYKLPSKVVDMFTLEDGEEQNKKYPDSFEIPDSYRRNTLKIGGDVKLMFNITPTMEFKAMAKATKMGIVKEFGERMWVKIVEVTEDGYVGTLANEPICNHKIKFGRKIYFEPRHVICTLD